jgi:hypothetical protein
MKAIRGQLTYANIVSTLCLFLLLGGATALAAGQLGKNSVGTQQLKKNSVTNAKIKNGAVTGAKVELSSLGTVPSATSASRAENATHADSATSATTALSATKANSAGIANNAGHADSAANADNADKLGGLGASQFVQGGGISVAGRATLVLGGGGLQPIVTVPGFGEVVGGCGSGGAAIGFVDHAGHDLRVFPFAGSDIAPVTVSDGASSGLFPAGVGSAGTTLLQIGSTDFTDQQLLTVVATRDADVSSHCNVQAWAVTR